MVNTHYIRQGLAGLWFYISSINTDYDYSVLRCLTLPKVQKPAIRSPHKSKKVVHKKPHHYQRIYFTSLPFRNVAV